MDQVFIVWGQLWEGGRSQEYLCPCSSGWWQSEGVCSPGMGRVPSSSGGLRSAEKNYPFLPKRNPNLYRHIWAWFKSKLMDPVVKSFGRLSWVQVKSAWDQRGHQCRDILGNELPLFLCVTQVLKVTTAIQNFIPQFLDFPWFTSVQAAANVFIRVNVFQVFQDLQ